MAKIIFATFGSAGDLFPLIPVVQQLRDVGDDVTLIVPRGLSLYTRALRIPSFATGDGREMRVFTDDKLYTTRCFGWCSWARTLDEYVAPTLEADVVKVRGFLAEHRPDLVVTSSFAVAARLVAVSDGYNHLECSIYPQHFALAKRDRDEFPRRTVDKVRRLAPGVVPGSHRATHIAWGCEEPALLLHDRAVLGHDAPEEVVVTGFPYWDDLPAQGDELAKTLEWATRSDDPVVVVTLGSFIGLRSTQILKQALVGVTATGARALLVGVKAARIEVPAGREDRVLSTGFLPMSKVLPFARGVVHHGGVGTMFAALRAGLPSIVLPQAFDQPFSVGLLERLGAGRDGRAIDLADAVQAILDASVLRDAAERVRLELADAIGAATDVADRISTIARIGR